MDGINGITAGYSLAILVPLALVNASLRLAQGELGSAQAPVSEGFKGFQEVSGGFVPESLLAVMTLAVVVFSIFNLTIVFLCHDSA